MTETRQGARLIEFVQLAMLQVLPTHLPVADYVVKGGANLRLFFDSRRRSQDIDLDYVGSAFWKVEDKLDETLASRVFRDLLRVAAVELGEVTKPKQTDTTRRWKFTISGPGARLNSKIEFSAREPIERASADATFAFEPARSDIGRPAGLRVVKANHYLAGPATRQKIQALAERSQTEPRDVFDLDLLFSSHPRVVAPGEVPQATLTRAIDAAFGIAYEAYEALVLDYLEDEFVQIYARREVWDEMVTTVVTELERLR